MGILNQEFGSLSSLEISKITHIEKRLDAQIHTIATGYQPLGLNRFESSVPTGVPRGPIPAKVHLGDQG
jgi:hypothetical protein